MATKDPLRFDDTDFKLTKLVGAGIAAATLVIAVIGPLVRWATGEPLVTAISATADEVVAGAVDAAKPGVTLTHGDNLVAEFANAGAGLWLASIAPSVLFLALLVGVFWLLWKLFDDVRAGQPFTLANVARMRGIAAIIIVGAMAMFFVGGLVNAYLLNHAIADSATFFANDSSVADLLLPGAGFLIAALAEAFKRGVQLEADVDGLV